MILQLIDEALAAGARVSLVCDVLGLSARTVQRWRDQGGGEDLCPIALDDAWKTCDWPGPLRRQVMDYNILDFSDPKRFDEQFKKLVDGIVEYYPPDLTGVGENR